MPVLLPLAKSALLPPGINFLLLLAGVLLLRVRRAAGRVLIVLAVVTLYVLCLPATSRLLAAGIEPAQALTPAAMKDGAAGAIVVPGCRRYAAAPEYGRDVIGTCGLARLRYALLIRQHTGLPMLLSGGGQWGERTAEAEIMQEALRIYFNTSARWLDDTSRNTRENAEHTSAILRRESIRRIYLVTTAMHMRRAAAEFRDAGLEVIPAPTDFRSVAGTEARWMDWLPQASALQTSHDACYEWLGYLWMELRVR